MVVPAERREVGLIGQRLAATGDAIARISALRCRIYRTLPPPPHIPARRASAQQSLRTDHIRAGPRAFVKYFS